MLESLRRLWSKGPKSTDVSLFQEWADKRGLQLKRVRDADGCTIEPQGSTAENAWRIEWGDSQRSYIEGRELRMSADIGTAREMLVLVLNRELMETMEKAVFEQYVEDVQTRIDTETPPEMRWLVMFPKLTGSELGKLKDRYSAVASVKPWLQLWLTAALEEALAETIDKVPAHAPAVFTITRGRLTFRTAMPSPDPDVLTRWHGVFERILPSARQLARDWSDASAGGATGTLRPSVWPPSRPTEDE
ncbi:hypothetical protein HLB44_22940 [Aquincola sp. S2]|uniref:Uncharacterized protein n=1 Tax=Pseudaquabacterium terrae TaxID=2732868 RepID=A0ABX2EMH0_9BURK|nr:hypothetical protein [Aquabacterium terrae]NRF69867.1 hypothetical protein [Aquabacterium terrae]